MAGAKQKDFIDEFKAVYKEKGKFDLKAEIPYLSKLGDRYKRRGKKDPKKRWNDLLKAHTLYNSCAVRDETSDKQRWMQARYDIQKIYWGAGVNATRDQVDDASQKIKQKLESLRTKMREKLFPVTNEVETWPCSFESLESSPDIPEVPHQLCDTIRALSADCNQSMVDIAHTVIEEAVGFCGEPPCEFSTVAFGSLGKGEATPYSDLEYMFLIDEHTDQTMEYFECLAVTSYFIIGNVQETKLKYMNIDELKTWFQDEAMNGFKIDGLSEKAGNIPTGNNLQQPKNHLILTSSELAEKYKLLLDNPAEDQHQPGDLTDMLTYATEVYNHNNNDLLERFARKWTEFKPNGKRKNASMHMLQEDINSYDFVPNIRHTYINSCINLKTDIYRYPSILINDLKIIYNLDGADTWETLGALLDKRIISSSLHDCLKFLLCAAQYIRFSAYLHADSQRDAILILLKCEVVNRPSLVSTWWHLSHGLLLQICLNLHPVKNHIVTNLKEENGLVQPLNFNKYVAATGFYKALGYYSAVISCIKTKYPTLENVDICTAYDLANAYYGLYKGSDYLKLMYPILKQVLSNSKSFEVKNFIATNFSSDDDKAVFHLNIEIAYAHARLDETSKALEILSQVSSMIKGDKLMKMYFNDVLAEVYITGSQTNLAIQTLKEACSLDLDTQSCENIGANLIRKLKRSEKLAGQFLKKGLVNQAEKTYSESLRIAHDIYGCENQHEDITRIYLNLADTAIKQKNLFRAKEYLEQTKKMMSHSNTHDKDIFWHFHIYSSDLLMAQEDYKGALRCLYAYIKIVGEWGYNAMVTPCDLGVVYLQFGKCYLNLGKIAVAERNLLLSKNYFDKAVVQDGEIVTTFEGRHECTFYLAKCCITSSGRLDKALALLQETLEGVYDILNNSIPAPHYLDDLDSSLIEILKARDKLSDRGVAIARSCCMHMQNIYTHIGKEKLAHRCHNKLSGLDV